MKEILGTAKTVRALLSDTKYSIDYYQREFKWAEKQVTELIDDLASKFLDDYEPDHERKEVQGYGHYFLGSIIISQKDNLKFVIDGQQRLTSLTLLLIYLRNLQKNRTDQVSIDRLIFSEQYGEKSFNIQVDEREPCMKALFEEQSFDASDSPESVQNILARYDTIKDHFPDELIEDVLPYFLDWLIDNVHLVEITAYSDDDAYTIFETMNDRGLSLTPTEMLKGFVLANITDSREKTSANNRWKQRIQELTEFGKEVDADCIKTWLRSQYAENIRERKKGAKPKDFDRIGTEFHRWVRDFRDRIGLDSSSSYVQFIERDFDFYARQYSKLMQGSQALTEGFEHVFYNAQHGFTLQYPLLLAPLSPDDSEEIVNLKMRLVAIYLDILLNRRMWNFRSISYSTMQYAMFLVMRAIRRKDPEQLADLLRQRLDKEEETFATNNRLRLHQQNRRYIHRLLARLTDYIEQCSGLSSRYLEYTTGTGVKRYEVEHILANKPERHLDEFSHSADFSEYRNRIGGLLLLPKSFNASYGDLTYEKKLPHYFGQNLLAKSLNSRCYEHNPGFLRFMENSGLPFQAHPAFKKADLDARQDLYRQIAEQVWNPERLTQEVMR